MLLHHILWKFTLSCIVGPERWTHWCMAYWGGNMKYRFGCWVYYINNMLISCDSQLNTRQCACHEKLCGRYILRVASLDVLMTQCIDLLLVPSFRSSIKCCTRDAWQTGRARCVTFCSVQGERHRKHFSEVSSASMGSIQESKSWRVPVISE